MDTTEWTPAQVKDLVTVAVRNGVLRATGVLFVIGLAIGVLYAIINSANVE